MRHSIVGIAVLFFSTQANAAATPTPTSTWRYDPNAKPVILYDSESNLHSTFPTPTPTVTVPVATPSITSAPPVRPPSDGTYSAVYDNTASGGSGSSADQAPILDPASIPREITFEPRTPASPSPRVKIQTH